MSNESDNLNQISIANFSDCADKIRVSLITWPKSQEKRALQSTLNAEEWRCSYEHLSLPPAMPLDCLCYGAKLNHLSEQFSLLLRHYC